VTSASAALQSAVFVLIGLTYLGGSPGALAQRAGAGMSLGGYGASSTAVLAARGSGGPMIPYAGTFGGFMPYRMGGAGSSSLSFSGRTGSEMPSSRTSVRLAPLSDGMGTGMAPRAGMSDRLASQGSTGMKRMPTSSRDFMKGTDTRTVMPPDFGYPFYQPPSYFAPALSGTGMTM
jgi:hypothetical protein